MKILPLLILLGGCATSLDTLKEQEFACVQAGEDCQEIYDQIVKQEAYLERRRYNRLSRCPTGTIEYCDWTMRGCGGTHKKPTDEFVCVNRDQLREVFRQW